MHSGNCKPDKCQSGEIVDSEDCLLGDDMVVVKAPFSTK